MFLMEIISYEIFYWRNGTICFVVIRSILRSCTRRLYGPKVFGCADYDFGGGFDGQGCLYWILRMREEGNIEGTLL